MRLLMMEMNISTEKVKNDTIELVILKTKKKLYGNYQKHLIKKYQYLH